MPLARSNKNIPMPTCFKQPDIDLALDSLE